MENNQNGKTLISSCNNKLEFKIPAWNQNAVESIRNTPLYKNSVRFLNSARNAERVLLNSSIDTHGWDTVSICRASALNTKIIAEKAYPPKVQEAFPGSRISINAELGAWQIVQGGGGANLQVSIPIKNGVFYGMQDHDDFDLAGSSFNLQICLNFFPFTPPQIEEGKFELHTNTDEKDSITVLKFNYAKGQMDDLNESLIKGVFQKFINMDQNKTFFDTIFSTVLVQGKDNTPEGFQWLKPTQISYAYSDSSEGVGTFGVMCMTSNEKHGGDGFHDVPSVPLESDQKSVFVVSRECFVKNRFFPQFREFYNNVPQENFTLAENHKSVIAKNLPLNDVKYNGIPYHPVADKFEIVFDDSLIRTESNISCQISPGIVLHLNIVTKYELVMSKNDQGENCLAYQAVGDPIVESHVETAKGIIITEIVLGIVGFLISAIAAVLIGAIVAVVIAVITVIAVGVMAFSVHYIIEKMIAEGITAKAPNIDPMVTFVSGQVLWPFCSQGGFKLTNIRYAGGIIFEGDLYIAKNFKMVEKRLMCA